MNRRVAALLAGICLALVVTTLWVPAHVPAIRFHDPDGRYYRSHPVPQDSWCWVAVWDSRLRAARENRREQFTVADGGVGPYLSGVSWPILIAEQALILLLGGGLLTWVMRRERRRRANG